ncbi:hypothetical protein D0499_02975 [Weissella soli]|uniref:hypothetical protein n=1 Tax=Weissella soli TaxID=155866 RepID=UPI0021C1F66E|nr:hypothetical protein [Weissella soli]MCT8394775.1 hypothetical protein [Weissella soli]
MKLVLLGLLVGVIVILIVRRLVRQNGKKETEKIIVASQHLVNTAMQEVLPKFYARLGVSNADERLTSTLVANIWGHNVMAFEFQIPVTTKVEPTQLKIELDRALDHYVADHHLVSASTDSAIHSTDVWFDQVKPILHIDVAHVVNEQTAAYIRDLRRLNQTLQQ